MANVSLSSAWHSFMPAYQHSLGLITQLLSGLSCWVILTRNAGCGAPVWVALVDINFGFLTAPKPLIPLSGRAVHRLWPAIIFITVAYTVAIIFCCFHFRFCQLMRMLRRESLFVAPSLHYLFEDPSLHAFVYDVSFSVLRIAMFAAFLFASMNRANRRPAAGVPGQNEPAREPTQQLRNQPETVLIRRHERVPGGAQRYTILKNVLLQVTLFETLKVETVIDRYRSIPYPTVYLSVHKEESGVSGKVEQRRLVKSILTSSPKIPIRNESMKMECKRCEDYDNEHLAEAKDTVVHSVLDPLRTESPAATALLLIVSAVVHICSCTRSAISVSLRHYDASTFTVEWKIKNTAKHCANAMQHSVWYSLERREIGHGELVCS
ncbi:hypothetical protein PRIPAC_87478 [Pristionchus pacificus]|uniref:Uncharacterized protein n=1 Tax=Pristionchus pacificus TaxID=54126 RepID=A0A2A6CWC2_PRIPA|nr:hypothetical protein PRIPAC_87478 [Pristionchus pacificus]|eukprot:PDM82428.1 hypothetical protein PRIPAC_36821 [Pristionchus pacificus]